MAYFPFQPGQQPMSSSQGVVIASDQSPVSVAGTVLVGNTNLNVSGSVAAFQAGTVITSISGTQTIAAFTSGASIHGSASVRVINPTDFSGSVLAFQGTPPWTVAPNNSSLFALSPAGSITSVTMPAGSVVATISPAGSITSVTNPAGSVTTVRINDLIQEETVGGPSIRGIPIVWESNANTSVMSTVSPTNPLRVSGSVSGRVEATQPAGSLLTVITPAGSVQSVTIPAGSITAVSATAPAGSIMATNQVAGSIMAVNATQPAGSLLTAIQLAGSVMAVSGVSFSAGNGSVIVVWQGSSVISRVTGSVATLGTAGSIAAVTVVSGSTLAYAPAGSLMAVVVNAGSVAAIQPAGSLMTVINPAGSITAVAGATTTTAGSIMSVTNPAGSVTTILGTFAEDAAFAEGGSGLATYGVRNDAVTSIAGADRDFSPMAVDETGRLITMPFAGHKACIISYAGSTVSGSVQLVAASIVGSRSYVTDFWFSNTGATTTLVTVQGGDTSILGQFIAPTGGGFSSPGLAIPLKTTLSQDLAFKVSPSTSVLYVVFKGYQAP